MHTKEGLCNPTESSHGFLLGFARFAPTVTTIAVEFGVSFSNISIA